MSKLKLFLDLDSSLIYSEELEYYDNKKNEKKQALFKYKDMDDEYRVFERPHLDKFLDYVFENFDVSVWTAASKDYAIFIIKHILLKKKPNRKLNYVLFSYHCDYSDEYKKGTKDLEMLWDYYKIKNFNKDNTRIVDDYDEVYKTQPKNCFKIKPFVFSKKYSEYDNELIKMIEKLKKWKKSKM
jgi:TFIIF-interacting CTD phosphatase-like protein